jgi:hypothetical protein
MFQSDRRLTDANKRIKGEVGHSLTGKIEVSV